MILHYSGKNFQKSISKILWQLGEKKLFSDCSDKVLS